MAKLTKEQARYAGLELTKISTDKVKKNKLMRSTFPGDRIPNNIRHENIQRDGEIALLEPVIAYLTGIAGEL